MCVTVFSGGVCVCVTVAKVGCVPVLNVAMPLPSLFSPISALVSVFVFNI